jgi:hypothetical protein
MKEESLPLSLSSLTMCTEWQHTNAGAPRARLQFEGELSPKHYQYIEEAGPLKPKLSQNLVKPFVLRFAKRCPTWTRIMWMQP